MNGNGMYEVARERIADQQRTARQTAEVRKARERRAAARGRRARKEAPETIVTPVIPDFVEEMFNQEKGGRHARAGH